VSTLLKTLPLPADPILAACASVLNDAGHWAFVLDAKWQLVFVTDETRVSIGDTGSATVIPRGVHWFSEEFQAFLATRMGGDYGLAPHRRAMFERLAPYVLARSDGSHEELRGSVSPEFADLVDDVQPEADLPAMWSWSTGSVTYAGTDVPSSPLGIRIDDDRGRFAGVCFLVKPAAGMSQLASAAAIADLGHLDRMRVIERPDRRPTAILMADLDASSVLSRRLSTAQFFAFGRRLVRAADRCVIDAGGIVGRHTGDGVVAFFLAETVGSESAAARSCITAARSLRALLGDIADRSDIPASELSLRFGLHWGATVYIGSILTAGRSEVTALGDEVNEAARIEACANSGQTLASKSLIERLGRADADTLGIDTDHTTYTLLADLPTATEKAKRDAPNIPVCEI
jgi:class 3 adenylate cyclase